MIRIQQIKVPLKHNKNDLEHKIRTILRLKPGQSFTFRIHKQSIDARRKNEVAYVYTADVSIDPPEQEKKVLQNACRKNSNSKNIMLTKTVPYQFPAPGCVPLSHRPVIAGSGPAGLFCAWQLALHGYEPVIVERGRPVEQRYRDVERFWQTGILDPSSNVQFGEGGAGTFSDGKLNTLVKDPAGRNRLVLETFVLCGAQESILYTAKPHIGTDQLINIVQNMRKEIIRMGGTFYFDTCLKDFETENGQLKSVTVSCDGILKKIETNLLVLAIGHSARDTFEMLLHSQVQMEAKAFATGFRIEHPQQMINDHQYKGADMRYLPAASYKVTANFENRRGVYSFCMCPGGYVVNASSEKGRLAVNGMSYHKRDGQNANSAVIVSVSPEEFPDAGPLGGIAFQKALEERAYQLGKGRIPQQLYGDYVRGICSTSYGDFSSRTKGGAVFADLGRLLPEELKQSLIRGVERFAGYIPGFNRYDAILSGVESRTSSPVRILRDKSFQASIRGIYPCGEGAGYAGGIMSAAMDGIKTAEAAGAYFKPFR